MNRYSEQLADLVEWYNKLPDEHRSKYMCKIILVLKEIVDKATPKVIGTDREHTNFWCPTCGLEQIRKDNYCCRCGQALSWGEEDE